MRAYGVGTLPVEVTHAFHSRLLDSVLAEYGEIVASVTRHAPSRPYISCVTGTWVTAEQATSIDDWIQQLRGTVLFAPAVRSALDSGTSVFVQLGPGLMAKSNLRRSQAQAVVVPGDAAAAIELTDLVATKPEAPVTSTHGTRRYPRPQLATPYRPATDPLEARIIALVEEELSTDGIGVDDDFFELGWDSLLTMVLASRLAEDPGFEVVGRGLRRANCRATRNRARGSGRRA